MNRASTLWVFTLLLFTLLACEQRPDGVLSKSEMTEVLYDYHLAQAMADWVRGDGTDSNQPLLDAVFAKHGITEEEFDSSLVWYNAHASDLKDIYDELQERFTLESQKLQLAMGENQLAALATESGDTTNLWNGPALLILRDTPLSNLEKYSVKGDSIFRTADRFILSGDVIFMSEERYTQDTRFLASLSVDLKNKKPVGESYTLQSSGHFSIDLQAPAHQLPTQLSCFFQYQSEDQTRNFCILHHLSLIRMHTHPADAESDSLMTDSTDTAAPADTLAEDTKQVQRHRQPRLSPDQLHLQNQGDRQKIEIRTAPERRTPNSFGPTRRKKK